MGTSIEVTRFETDRGYYHTKLKGVRDEVFVHLYERSTEEELLGIRLERIAVEPSTATKELVKDMGLGEMLPTENTEIVTALSRDQARVLGQDLIHFAETGRLPSPK